MDSEYEQSQEEFEVQDCDPEEFAPKKKKMTKNQQIYGDFVEAYDPEPTYIFSKNFDSYGQFKAGSTIQSYTSEVEVTMPLKPKAKQNKKMMEEEEEGSDQPMLGQFSLNSFLNQLGKDELDDIAEENQDSSVALPEGLNDKILDHLQLVRIGEEETQEPLDVEHLTFERYMRMGKPAPPPPKYKTEQEKQLAKSYKDGYGVGFKMMQKMGFTNITKGLGKNESGIHKPVEAQRKTAFTMKDQAHSNQNKKDNKLGSEPEEEEIVKEQSIPERLFGFRSKNTKINNFLLQLQKDYERLNSQIYFLENEVSSMNSKLQISLSTQCQEENSTEDLKKQIQKLETIGQNIDRCVEYPHLGQHYQIDVLFVKKVFDKFRNNDFQFIHDHAEKELLNLKSALNRFYISKSKESIKMFEQTTGIETKMHKSIKKKSKRQKNVIDLDNPSDDEVQIVTIGVEEKEKISKFIDLLINKALIPHIDRILGHSDSLEKVKQERVIDLINVVYRFDERQTAMKKMLQENIMPLYENYINRLNLDDFETERVKCLPHMVILPWLHLLKMHSGFSFMKFYKNISRKLWNIESSVLYSIITPLLKFSSQKDINFFRNLYLAPRIMCQLESFTINSPSPTLLNGFTKYSELLSAEIRDQILENTLFVEVQHVYNKYIKEKDQKEVLKWLKGWKKFSDKISPGKFSSVFSGKIPFE